MISFTKMHGLGNDILIIDNFAHQFKLTPEQIITLADRHIGIGFDQLLVLSDAKDADVFCTIFNADGSEAEQCGNGLRCAARFMHEANYLGDRKTLKLQTKSGIFPTIISDYKNIEIQMGTPVISEKTYSFIINHTQAIASTIISIGNPHAIIKFNDIFALNIDAMSKLISAQPYFSNGVNIGYMQIVNRQHIYLRTNERGVGETLACGSNACAAVAAGVINGWLDSTVVVELTHGSLTINYENQIIKMSGPADRIYDGRLCDVF